MFSLPSSPLFSSRLRLWSHSHWRIVLISVPKDLQPSLLPKENITFPPLSFLFLCSLGTERADWDDFSWTQLPLSPVSFPPFLSPQRHKILLRLLPLDKGKVSLLYFSLHDWNHAGMWPGWEPTGGDGSLGFTTSALFLL